MSDLISLVGANPHRRDEAAINAVSEDTKAILQRISSLESPQPPSSLPSVTGNEAAAVFNAVAQAKILTSKVAMHLRDSDRRRLFQQVDNLHDISEWEPGDQPVSKASYSTFLKAIVYLNPSIKPGLGMTRSGNLIAAWTEETARLTLEFLAGDLVRWTLSRKDDQQTERAAGETSVKRIKAVLAPYNASDWLHHADRPA